MRIREISTPLLVEPEIYRNATDILNERTKKTPHIVAFKVQHGTSWHNITSAEFSHSVRALAKVLMSLGIKAGDSVAIMGPTSYDWSLIDMAALYAGAIVVPIYDSSSELQVRKICTDAEVKCAFAGTAEQYEKLKNALNSLHHNQPYSLWNFSDVESLEQKYAQQARTISDEDLEARRLHASLDDVATIVYTSGTQGNPKGANMTHRNFVGQILNISEAYKQVVHEEGCTVVFLPLAHVFARALQLICLSGGMTIVDESNPKKAIALLPEVKPTFMVVVPRVLQKIVNNVEAAARDKYLLPLWKQAERTAIRYGKYLEKKRSGVDVVLPRTLKTSYALFDKLFYKKIRGLLGGNIEILLCGAAPLDRNLALMFTGMDLLIVEGYGLTETTAPLTGNTIEDNVAGTVGRPEPGNTVRISDDGEILAQGVGVFAGYRNEEDNKHAFVDGFFRTGDLGELDSQGRLRITGRLKDAIVTAGGKTISPQGWETEVEKNPAIAHAVVVGDNQPYLAALIVVDPEEVSLAHQSEEISRVNDADVLASVQASVDTANAQVARPEQVRKTVVISLPLNPGGKFVTPTLKLKRKDFLTAGQDVIESIYHEQGGK